MHAMDYGDTEMTKTYFCWTSTNVEADSRDEAAQKFREAVKENMTDLVIEDS